MNQLENTIKEETNMSREIVDSYNNIRSYMFWGGFMNMSDYECNKFLFKELNLEKYCPKKVCYYYKDRDRHAEFFKKYKDNEELLSYIANILTNEYKNRCEI